MPRSIERPFGVELDARSLGEHAPADLDRLATREKIVLLRGLNGLPAGEFLAWARSFPGRSLLEWNFGPMLELKERPDAKNYLFTREAAPFHWDGAFHREPAHMLFFCVEAPGAGAGGETLFCDSEAVWESASPAERATLSSAVLTYETEKLAHYGGTVAVPLLGRHPETGRPVLRFAEPVTSALNPLRVSVAGAPAEELLGWLKERIYDERFSYAHEWREGDVLIADNRALLHGRRAYEKDAPRHLRRIQLI